MVTAKIILSDSNTGKFFTVPNLIEKYLSKGLSVGAYNIKDYWMGIENMENLKKVGARLNKKSI